MKKIIALIIALLFLVSPVLCSCGERDLGASFDWGPGKYWDNNEHTVKDKLW